MYVITFAEKILRKFALWEYKEQQEGYGEAVTSFSIFFTWKNKLYNAKGHINFQNMTFVTKLVWHSPTLRKKYGTIKG